MSGEVYRTPDLVLDDTENITNEKINRVGGGTYRVGAGSIGDRELAATVAGGFNTVSALRANTDSFDNNDRVSVKGYYTATDGNFGPDLIVDTSDTTTSDNGYTCFVDTNGLRFKRSIDAPANARWAGAKGDGTTDDTAALQLIIDSLIQDSGGVMILDKGQYLVSEALYFEYLPHTDPDAGGVRRIGGVSIRGQGTAHNDSVFEGDTRASIILESGATTGILDLDSVWNCSFEGIMFICKSTDAEYMVRVRSQDSPSYSSTHTKFSRCVWRDDGDSLSAAQVVLRDCKHVEFENCSWTTGGSDAFRIGENTGVNGTLMDGNVSSLSFINCYFAGDIKMRQARAVSFNTCEWFPRKGGTGESSKIEPEGDETVRSITFNNCKAIFDGDDTGTFFEQGTQGSGLSVISGEYGDHNRAFVLNGTDTGVASFVGPRFRNNGAGVRDIEIQNTYAGRVLIQGDHADTMGAGNQAVTDARTFPGGQFAFHDTVTSLFTFASVGNYESILSDTVQLRGGLYRVSYNININSNNSTSYRARLNVDGVANGFTVTAQSIDSGETGTLSYSNVLAISGTTSAVTVKLECRQAAGTASTIPAQSSVDGTTFMVIEEI